MNETIIITFSDLGEDRGIDPRHLVVISTSLDKVLAMAAKQASQSALPPLQIILIGKGSLRVVWANALRRAKDDPIGALADIGGLSAYSSWIMGILLMVGLARPVDPDRAAIETCIDAAKAQPANEALADACVQLTHAILSVDGGEATIEMAGATRVVILPDGLRSPAFMASMPRVPVLMDGANEGPFEGPLTVQEQRATGTLDGRSVPIAIGRITTPPPPHGKNMPREHSVIVIWRSQQPLPDGQHVFDRVRGRLLKTLAIDTKHDLDIAFMRADGFLIVEGVMEFR